MTADNPREIIDEFMTRFNQLVRGEPVDPFGWLEMLDEDVSYVRQGLEPIVARCRSRAEAREKLFPADPSRSIKLKPGFGVYPLEYIQEGNRIVVIAKGRGDNIYGIPYNNTYFFFFEVVNGKIVRAVEDLDASITLRSICNTHLEEGLEPQR